MSDLGVQQGESESSEILIELERLDRIQHLLEAPKNTAVGFVIFVPSLLVVTAFQLWENGHPSRVWFIASGIAFVGFLLIAIVLNITQWIYARAIIKWFITLNIARLGKCSVKPDGPDWFGPFKLEWVGQRVLAKRPFAYTWRLHRPVLILVATMSFLGYILVIGPSVYASINANLNFMLAIGTLGCLSTIRYARQPKVVAWIYDTERRELLVQQLAGVVRTETHRQDVRVADWIAEEPTGCF